MRRMLISLPIALLILTAVILPYSVNADSHLFSGYRVSIGSPVHTGPSVISTPYIAADNATDLPDGLTLSKGIPFISPTEVEQGKLVTIKVTATNNSPFDLTYPLAVKINGNPAGTAQQLTLAPAGSDDIVFTITAQSPGNNDVKVGNLQGFFTVKGSSFFDMFPPYLWGFFGIVLGVIVMLIVLVVTKPSRKGKAGAQPDTGRKPVKGKGKPGQPGTPDAYPLPGQMPRQGMPGGMPMGMQGPGQPPSPYDMPMPGMPPGMQQPGQPPSPMGMQPQFQSHPGMPPQFPQPQQPGMAPSSPQGMHPPSMQGPQYPPQPHMPQAGQQYPGQPPAQGMPPPISGAPVGQPGMPFGMQPPAPPMPHMMPPPAPGMQQAPYAGGQPPMAPSGPQGMYPPTQPGMQQGMPYQQMGMQQPPYQQMGMPKFSVSNLTITPNNVKVGEPVNVSIIVSNNGAQMGKYSVVLRVGGVVENITDMALTPGASQTASFVVIKDAAGDYYADIEGLGGFFTVIPLAPPSFTVSNFSISPERVRQGQPVIVTASVTNMGEITGSHPLILRVKGIAEAQHDVTLGPNKTQDIEFQIVKDTPGFYPVSMENWTGKFVVEMDWTG